MRSLLLLVAYGVALLPTSAYAGEPTSRDPGAAIDSGDFRKYFVDLSTWLDRKVPSAPAEITKKTVRALIRDPVFTGALARRHFMTKVWGPHKGLGNLDAFAKAGPGNRAFLAWVMRDGAVVDDVMLTRTPSAMFARIDDSHSIEAGTLANWKRIYYAYPESRKGLYLRLAVATVLRPPGTGNRGAGMAKQQSTPFDRFTHYLKAHKSGDLLPSFDTLSTWELTHVVSSCASNADLAWGREMVNTFMPGLRAGEQISGVVSQMKYEGSQIPYEDFSCLLAGGGKCGPRSSFGVFIHQAFGIPSIGVGQPAHAAVCWRRPDGNWQIGYGRGWNVSKVWDRYKMSGAEFLERVKERRSPGFARVEHLRWLAAVLERPDGGYLPPADRRYTSARAAAVMALAPQMAEARGHVEGIPVDSKPDQRTTLRAFDAPRDSAEHYGSRVRGFVYPPRSGDYVFRVAADDEADLFLSTTEDPADKVFIAHLREWTEPRRFDKFASQTSKPVRLEAGRKYYIEAVHREVTGGDHLAVAWSGPGVSAGVIQGAALSPYPSGARGTIPREVWRTRTASAATPKTATKPEPPIRVPPGVIHVEAEAFFTRGGTSFYGGQHPSVPVVDCHTGGKQLCFQTNMGDAYVGYRVDVPRTGVYELTARAAVVNWGQSLFVRTFGSMPRPKSAKVSAVFHNMVRDLGADKATDQHLGTRWAVNEGVDQAWLELDMGKPTRISTVLIDERLWNRVSKFQVEYRAGNAWRRIFEGTNIGVGFRKTFPPVTAQHIRLKTLDCRDNGGPTIWEFSVGDVEDGQGFITPKWSRALAGRWQTTEPVDMRLVKGAQTIWLCAGYQRALALRWFRLTPKRK